MHLAKGFCWKRPLLHQPSCIYGYLRTYALRHFKSTRSSPLSTPRPQLQAGTAAAPAASAKSTGFAVKQSLLRTADTLGLEPLYLNSRAMVGEFTRMTRKKQFKEAAACKNEGSQAPDLVPLDSDQQKKPQPVEDSGAISKQLSTLSIPRPSETSRPTTSQSTISTLHPCRGKLPVNTPPSKATTKPRGPRSGSPPRASRQRSRDASRPFPRLLPVKSPATPIPERSYLTRSAMPASKLQNPQPLLLVLDLNGTLLYRPRSSSNYTPRPSLSSFLAHCVSNYSVLVWSSATPFNVTAICSKIFSPEQRKLLLGEWARDTLELDKEQYASKVQVYKRLSRIWQDMRVQRAHPESAKGVRWGQENTLLLDDSVLKASAQPHNAVVLPEFTQEAGEEQKDGTEVLAQVVAYLETGRMVDNVSSFVRSRSFKVDTGWKWDWAKGSSTETELSDDGDDEAGGVKIEEA